MDGGSQGVAFGCGWKATVQKSDFSEKVGLLVKAGLLAGFAQTSLAVYNGSTHTKQVLQNV